MHELSLVASIIESIDRDARDRAIKKITRARIVVGELSSVNTRALSFALENVGGGTVLEGAEIEIFVREAREKCRDCRREFKPLPPFYQCPACGQTVVPGAESRQVYIDYYEGE
ncbi:MAG: hydrogenase maturation nickel metallochaperone HypA [Bacillota bacterium]